MIIKKIKLSNWLQRSILASILIPASLIQTVHATQPQVGDNPIVIDQAKVTDNVSVLMAASGSLSDGVSVTTYGGAKAGYVSGLNDTSEYIEWNITLAEAADYRIYAMISGNGTAQPMTVSVSSSSLNFSTSSHSDFSGWDKVDAGVVSIPVGSSTIRLKKVSNDGASSKVKSLELIKESDVAAFEQRVTSFRSDTSFLSNAKYGIMLQYGHWGYPQSGDKKSIDQQAQDFDVDAFIHWAKSTGAGYIVWSASWWTFELNTPSPVTDAILNNGENTSQRDLIGDVATAAENAGLDFILYYHSGHDVHRSGGYGSTPWWQAQNFPSTFASRAYGDRSQFFNNWTNVMTELGNKFGTKLDGWFFDDGLVYYPGNFESMGNAAKAGNPDRIIGYSSSGGLARVTEFQDINFGEACHGEQGTGSAPEGGDGIYISGPEKGLLQHCMFTMEPYTDGADWGIHSPNQVIGDPWVTAKQLTDWVDDSSARNVPLSINVMMYEDGSISDKSKAILSEFAEARGVLSINDNSAQLTHSGTWTTASNRGAGDYDDDISHSSTANDFIEYSFYGNQVDIVGPKDTGGSSITVTLDGIASALISTTSATYKPQEILFSQGNLAVDKAHTIRFTAGSSGYSQLDAIKVYKPIVNNTSESIVYNGNWTLSSSRAAGDIADDVHYTVTDNDFLEYSFNGTGVEVIAPKDIGGGLFDVYIDGIKVQSNLSLNSSTYQAASSIFAKVDLSAGAHTLKVQKVGGSYIQIDAISYYDASINDNDARINYTGSWASNAGRGLGDFEDDVKYTLTNEDYAEFSFTGTGIDYIGPKGSSYGTFEIMIDGLSQGIHSAVNASYLPQELLFSKKSMPLGNHTLKIIKKSGSYTHVDALIVYP